MGLLEALFYYGVEYWDGFDDAMANVENDNDEMEILYSLMAAGVENWEHYDQAYQLFSDDYDM